MFIALERNIKQSRIEKLAAEEAHKWTFLGYFCTSQQHTFEKNWFRTRGELVDPLFRKSLVSFWVLYHPSIERVTSQCFYNAYKNNYVTRSTLCSMRTVSNSQIPWVVGNFCHCYVKWPLDMGFVDEALCHFVCKSIFVIVFEEFMLEKLQFFLLCIK